MSDYKVTHTTGGGGLGIVGVLTIVFVVLKLTGVIAWSWVWVLSPLWIGFILWLILAAFLLGIVALLNSRRY